MDIRGVDLNLLKAFDALMAERAVTRAAARVGLSQPAMSHALSRLRNLFADELFVRGATGMAPTARAAEIAPLIAGAIEQVEAALNISVSFDPARSTGVFHAGIGEGAEVVLIERLAGAFARQAANATLRLTSVNGADATEQLDRGAIDVAVARLVNVPTRLHAQTLMQDPFVVTARRGHPLAGGPMSIRDYMALKHILITPRGNTFGSVDRFLAELGLTRRIFMMIVSYLALPGALAATDLVATVPRHMALHLADIADIEIMPLPINLSRTVSMAWHPRAASEPAQLWFRSLLIDAAGER